jgi:hypothetical protein
MVDLAGLFDSTEAVPMFQPNLLKGRAFMKNGKPQGEPKFSGDFGYKPDSADLRDIKTLCAKLARARWPGRNLAELAKPWQDGTAMADKAKAKFLAWEAGGRTGKKCYEAEYYRGLIIIKARSNFRPALGFVANSRIVDLTDDTIVANIGKLFFGAEVLAQFNFAAYEGVGQNPDGLNAYLNSIVATGGGTKLGGSRPSASEVFRGYVGHTSAEDPTQNENEGGW